MEIIETHHSSYICEPDRVTVGGIRDEADNRIVDFAAPHSHSKTLTAYWSTSVNRYDNGTAVVRFYKD